METLEAIKTALEIIVIFLTLPQYAPLFASILALGSVYYLIKELEKEEEQEVKNMSEPEEQNLDSKMLDSTNLPPESK